MKKDIKDYLHLYFYSEIEITEVFISVGYKVGQRFVPSGGELALAIRENPVFACKPILRPLSSITEEECDQFGIHYTEGKYNRQCFEADATYGGTFRVYSIESISDRVNQMRNAGIDCDGLIESGLAVTAETLK